MIAIGDLHGDFEATLSAFRVAGVIDDDQSWSGGTTLVVVVGDFLDRGDGEVEIMAFFERIEAESVAAGGELVVLNGNHEVMNAEGDLRYVTPGGFAAFQKLDPSAGPQDARLSAFRPGGVYAKKLSRYDIITVREGTVFVHGGVLPEHVAYGIERINKEARAWLAGDLQEEPAILRNRDSPIWTLRFSDEEVESDCAALAVVLRELSASRMVVGHETQEAGITSACDGTIWRTDVGLAKLYGGPTQVLEIVGDRVRPIGSSGTLSPR